MKTEEESNTPNDKTSKSDFCSKCSVKPLCAAISSIGNSILFVDYDITLHCDKAMSFGFSHICKCKERLKFYQTYKK
jgi:hypothetical protein